MEITISDPDIVSFWLEALAKQGFVFTSVDKEHMYLSYVGKWCARIPVAKWSVLCLPFFFATLKFLHSPYLSRQIQKPLTTCHRFRPIAWSEGTFRTRHPSLQTPAAGFTVSRATLLSNQLATNCGVTTTTLGFNNSLERLTIQL